MNIPKQLKISALTKRKLKKLAIPALFIILIGTLGVWIYGQSSKSPTFSVYTLGRDIGRGEFFGELDLNAVNMQFSDSQLLQAVVVAPSEALAAQVAATRDLKMGALLSPDDFSFDVLAEEEQMFLSQLPDNWLVTALQLPPPPTATDARIITQPGFYQIVRDTYPPKHIACVFQPEGGGLMLDLEDYAIVAAWLDIGGIKTLKNTVDECPVGGNPLRCGFLTNPIASTTTTLPADDITESVEVLLDDIPDCVTATTDDMVEAIVSTKQEEERRQLAAKLSSLLSPQQVAAIEVSISDSLSEDVIQPSGDPTIPLVEPLSFPDVTPEDEENFEAAGEDIELEDLEAITDEG